MSLGYDDPLTGNGIPAVRAAVSVGGAPLAAQAEARLTRVVVDNDLHLPGMFELTFLDLDGTTLSVAGITTGTQISVGGTVASATSVMPTSSAPLITGEVTAIEGQLRGLTVHTVVRGYTMAHRLQRARRSRTFLNSTDADIATQIATQAGLTIGMIVPTTTTHAYLPQVNQTDWEFLQARAIEIGYETGVADGAFYFRPEGAGGGAAGLLAQATSASVKFPETLISFRPRITAGNITPDVELRVWDPLERKAFAQNTSTPAGMPPAPATLGSQFTPGGLGAIAGAAEAAASAAASGNILGAAGGAMGAVSGAESALSSATGGLIGSPIGDLGPPPSPTAHVLSDRPLATGLTIPTAGPAAAAALGSDLGSTFAEAEGDAVGDAAIQPGVTLTITGVPDVFAGGWRVSRAQHIFDDREHGYRTIFAAHGRQDRSVLGLTSRSTPVRTTRPSIDGVVCGVVSNCGDPLGKGRVKVTLPWLSPDFETDWAPSIQFCAGQRTGASFMPEVGDEVLLAFEFGDPRRPYVLGGMINNFTQWSVAAAGPISAGGLSFAGGGLEGLIGSAAGAAIGSMLLGPAGGMAGTVIGSAVGSAVASSTMGAISGEVTTPGMVSEIHHRGYVSSTGNCLLFYDEPLPLPTATGALDAVTDSPTGDPVVDSALQSGMQSAAASGGIGSPGMGALASAVRIGSQGGEIGLTVDQVNAGVSLTCNSVPGVSTIPLPSMNISSENGFIQISAGTDGNILINGGQNVVIAAEELITLQAEAINIIGIPLVNGIPIPI
jgi:hypothetical protein